MSKSTLSVVASAMARALRGVELDNQMGPLPADFHEMLTVHVVRLHGWTPQEYNSALVAATSERWALFSGLEAHAEPIHHH